MTGPGIPSAEGLSAELVERMVALVRCCDGLTSDDGIFVGLAGDAEQDELAEEVRAIAALLPEPVDPDLIEARLMAANDVFIVPPPHFVSDGMIIRRNDLLAGRRDDDTVVRCYLEGIKRGRELAKRDPSHAA